MLCLFIRYLSFSIDSAFSFCKPFSKLWFLSTFNALKSTIEILFTYFEPTLKVFILWVFDYSLIWLPWFSISGIIYGFWSFLYGFKSIYCSSGSFCSSMIIYDLTEIVSWMRPMPLFEILSSEIVMSTLEIIYSSIILGSINMSAIEGMILKPILSWELYLFVITLVLYESYITLNVFTC